MCEVVADTNDVLQNIVYEDEAFIAFLDSYPRAYGYTLVAPKVHRERVTADFDREEYLGLQDLNYRVTEAGREEVGAERMYILSLGSNESISHVHWHVVPLPPSVPYEDQQRNWATWSKGVLDIAQEDMAPFARKIRWRMDGG